MLADHLLYTPEKTQYKEIMERMQSQNSTPSQQQQSQTQAQSQAQETQSEKQPEAKEQAGSEKLANDVGSGTSDHNAVDTKMDVDPQGSTPIAASHSSQPVMPSAVYGAEHLLRLFVKMPLFLAHAQLPNSHVHTLHHYFKDLMG